MQEPTIRVTPGIKEITPEVWVDRAPIPEKDINVKLLSDKQLTFAHALLHSYWHDRPIKGWSDEDFINLHALMADELKRRKIAHIEIDDLDEQSKKFETLFLKVKLQEFLDALPDEFELKEPAHIMVVGGLVNRGESSGDQDIDILVRQNYPDWRIADEFEKILPSYIRDKLHYVWDAEGSLIGYHVPLYKICFKKLDEKERKPPAQLQEFEPARFVRDIDKISDAELMAKHDYVHKLWKQKKAKRDGLIDAHTTIVLQMRQRVIEHPVVDELDKETYKIIIEYPMPGEKKVLALTCPPALKAASGFEKFEFYDYETFWKNWGSKFADRGIAIEEKLDGFRHCILKDGKTVKIITEDRRRDRSAILVDLADDIRKLKIDRVILDCEILWFNPDGTPKEREEAIGIIVRKEPIKGEDIRAFCFDCLYFKNKSLVNLPWNERQIYLKKSLPKDTKFLRRVTPVVIHSFKGLVRAANAARKVVGSEGFMAKVVDSIYELDRRTTSWAKFKKSIDIDVEVEKIVRKQSKVTGKIIPGVYMYDCIVRGKKGERIPIGRTFSTSIEAKVGDIISVRTQRLRGWKKDEKIVKFSWMWPKVLQRRPDLKKPTPLEDLVKVAWFPKRRELELLALLNPLRFDIFIPLRRCPHSASPDKCILFGRFKPVNGLQTFEQLSVYKQSLKFPIACKFATRYRCEFVKDYYYEWTRLK